MRTQIKALENATTRGMVFEDALMMGTLLGHSTIDPHIVYIEHEGMVLQFNRGLWDRSFTLEDWSARDIAIVENKPLAAFKTPYD